MITLPTTIGIFALVEETGIPTEPMQQYRERIETWKLFDFDELFVPHHQIIASISSTLPRTLLAIGLAEADETVWPRSKRCS